MPSTIEVIEDQENWNQLLEKVDGHDFYHTFDYHQLSKSDDEKPILIKYEYENKIIGLPLLMRKIFDTDYFDITSVYGYAGPLSKNIDESFDADDFKKQLEAFFKENKIVSVFTRLNPYIQHQEVILGGLGEIKTLSKIVNINLTRDLDIQRSFFSKTTKRYINKARKQCTVRNIESEDDIIIFKELYYENMDRVNAKESYYFPENYFNSFINSKEINTDVLFAIHNETNKIISAAMMVKTNKIIQYHISGTRNDYLYLTPIRLLIDEMRIRGTQENYTCFNLGGGLGNQEDSLFKFKASFSKDSKDFKIWKFIVNQEIYDKLTNQYAPTMSSDFFPKYRG
ncbi:peptidoglycan bridge formation glycyltransferase FemA/FemB family protein [Aquimarina sp. RZ0]|uniref:peptidoglycan bridge formation glycyltransferase FemA/FemB family protein n=1 Tax=Aquimarina sp. RZ0 TaxID=2607730 RepID=UPI0011F21F9C|nr:peptidoglycan bridge formation glycyltransferase FemA/FemB family protein [Aquimarina sp. RZ0]KAA1246933.1 GNAT family N-acetyltransferase [Aquimarina sp. RZ0]